jgi:integrase
LKDDHPSLRGSKIQWIREVNNTQQNDDHEADGNGVGDSSEAQRDQNGQRGFRAVCSGAVPTGLRVSELIGLKWRCIHADSITVEERFSRGDWSVPKTQASAATIAVDSQIISRILCLKTLSVKVRAGSALRTHKVVKVAGPDDLVFQSVQTGKPMNDQNILKRHIQPAARRLGLAFVNWRCLRTSHATWLVQAGADPKSVQGQMRHSRVSTTMDIYAQIVPIAQRRALEQLAEFAKDATPDARSNSRSITVQ